FPFGEDSTKELSTNSDGGLLNVKCPTFLPLNRGNIVSAFVIEFALAVKSSSPLIFTMNGRFLMVGNTLSFFNISYSCGCNAKIELPVLSSKISLTGTVVALSG